MSLVPGSTPNPRPLRVLLVEDNVDARLALARYLELFGIEVVLAGDRADVTTALDAPERLDVVVTDLMLPDVDGREIADRARKRDPAPLTILITGWDQALGKADCAAHGIHHLLYKPLDLPALIRLILPPSHPAATNIAGSAIDRPADNP